MYYICDVYEKFFGSEKFISGIIDVEKRGNVILGEFGVKIEMFIRYYEREMEIRRVIVDRYGEGRCYCVFGYDYIIFGYYKLFIEYFEKVFEISEVIGSRKVKLYFYVGFGNVYYVFG